MLCSRNGSQKYASFSFCISFLMSILKWTGFQQDLFLCSFLVWLVSVELVLDTITKRRIKHLESCFCYANSDKSSALQSFCSIIKADMF